MVSAKPTKQQAAWQDLEMGMFCHFGLNTFHDREWGDGTDDPRTFLPEQLDARQWVREAQEAGFRYFVLTAKHHDGFCLWPTKTTDYSVRSSPWKNGQGDVVGECAAACAEAGMPFGVYLSPWDRHEPCYSDAEAYDDFYCRQLEELLTSYGPLVEVWFDGAGSEGRTYNWKRIIDLVDRYQPNAMVFNMGRPTIRWVGNEIGTAPYPSWNTAKEAKVSMFTKATVTWLPDTPEWLPAECDVPLRKKHWFWHPNDESSLRTLDELIHIYDSSVGHGATLLLNVSPDDRGLFPEADIERIRQFGEVIRARYAAPLAQQAGDGDLHVLELPQPASFNHAVAMEHITEGERVREYVLEAETVDGDWTVLATGSAIGHKRVIHFAPTTASRVRLRITRADDTPLIRSIALYDIQQ